MNHYFISRERCDALQNLVQWHLFLHTTVLRFNWVRELHLLFPHLDLVTKSLLLITYSD